MSDISELQDVGLIDRIIRMRRWEAEQPDGRVQTRTQSLQQPIPEEIMSKLQTHLGDALAKVTVGGELGHSRDYGCKAQSFVSISVHCNNEESAIEATHEILHGVVRRLVNEDLEAMKEDRDKHLGAPATPPPPVGRVAQMPAAKTTKPRTQPKTEKKPSKPRVARPSFRR